MKDIWYRGVLVTPGSILEIVETAYTDAIAEKKEAGLSEEDAKSQVDKGIINFIFHKQEASLTRAGSLRNMFTSQDKEIQNQDLRHILKHMDLKNESTIDFIIDQMVSSYAKDNPTKDREIPFEEALSICWSFLSREIWYGKPIKDSELPESFKLICSNSNLDLKKVMGRLDKKFRI